MAINGFISLYANFDKDLCLIPKCHPFTLKELVENLEITYSMISPLKLALFMPVKESAKVLIMFNQPVVYECFVHHPLVILLTALEASNALLAYWEPWFLSFSLIGQFMQISTFNSCAHYSHKFAPWISTSCGQFSSY
ncbi:hypothetical protein CMV_026675 [Castanea mollissima]|uniref:Uncharacterized protein n=1 Tax=Castanea mollissima TaxID=60419 RepID=A0A8J4VFP5_9ROSI|nr:hypothetical protein CMV_026675 [Castanea mollissima]